MEEIEEKIKKVWIGDGNEELIKKKEEIKVYGKRYEEEEKIFKNMKELRGNFGQESEKNEKE